MSTVHLPLVRAYLSNAQLALHNFDTLSAASFVEHTLALLAPTRAPLPGLPTTQIAVGVGLDTGIKRQGKPNEDTVFATTGCIAKTQETYGLFVVADGMGGHARGREASHLATQTLVDGLLPLVQSGRVQGLELGNALIDAVKAANRALYQRNQQAGTQELARMGTTMTVALTIEAQAFFAQVGDSRAYLYRPGMGLRAVTRDHSVVAELIARGAISSEEAYTHEKRNQITRCLGAASSIGVDLYTEQLHDEDILLLCSDGLWEMVRDPQIEQILSTNWLSADNMAERLVFLARQGGGLDNIGLVVSQYQVDITAMQTMTDALPGHAVVDHVCSPS